MSSKSGKFKSRSKRGTAVKRARTLIAEQLANRPKLDVPHRTDVSEDQAARTPHIKPAKVSEVQPGRVDRRTDAGNSALDQAFADMPRVSPSEMAAVDAAFSVEPISPPAETDTFQLHMQLTAQLRELDRQRQHLKMLLERIE